jgi:hypothetical protein
MGSEQSKVRGSLNSPSNLRIISSQVNRRQHRSKLAEKSDRVQQKSEEMMVVTDIKAVQALEVRMEALRLFPVLLALARNLVGAGKKWETVVATTEVKDSFGLQSPLLEDDLEMLLVTVTSTKLMNEFVRRIQKKVEQDKHLFSPEFADYLWRIRSTFAKRVVMAQQLYGQVTGATTVAGVRKAFEHRQKHKQVET